MRKIALCIFALVLLAGCESGQNEVTNGVQLQTIRVQVNANDWRYTQQEEADQYNNNYYYVAIDMPEITEDVFDYGEVKAYAVYDRWNVETACKQLLPFVLHVEECNDAGEWYYYTQTMDFTYGIGWAMVNYTRSDFLYEDSVTIVPPAIEFDIVISYP